MICYICERNETVEGWKICAKCEESRRKCSDSIPEIARAINRELGARSWAAEMQNRKELKDKTVLKSKEMRGRNLIRPNDHPGLEDRDDA